MQGAGVITFDIFKRKIWNSREEEKKVSLNNLIETFLNYMNLVQVENSDNYVRRNPNTKIYVVLSHFESF